MDAIRFAWRLLSFSSPSSATASRHGQITYASTNRSGSSNRRRLGRVSLHRACSAPLSTDSSGRKRSVRPGAYEVIKSQGSPRELRVVIPEGTVPGSEFTRTVGRQQIQLRCPINSKAGNYVKVVVPGETTTRQRILKPGRLTMVESQQENAAASERLWAYPVNQKRSGTKKIRVPPRVQPGMTFVTTIQGKQLSVTCPEQLPRSRRIRVALDIIPKQQQKQSPSLAEYCDSARTSKCSSSSESEGLSMAMATTENDLVVASVDLRYDEELSNGWMRRLRPWDGKFQWIPTSKTTAGLEVESSDRFDHKRLDDDPTAYCRQLQVREGKDPRLPTGTLALVSSGQALVGGSTSPETIRDVQLKPLEEKTQWIRSVVVHETDNGGTQRSIKMVIRREHLLQDSLQAILSLGTDQLQKPWKVEFVHEPAVDSGGVTREWFQLVSEQLFDPDNGLWVASTANQMCVSINPHSAAACSLAGNDHLMYFRFAGRLLGRALLDQQIVRGHLARYLYKHILGWPLALQDLADADPVYLDSLQKLQELSEEEIDALCLDFTLTEQQVACGKHMTIELVPNGASRSVNRANLHEYYQALVRYRLMDRIQPQLTELLLGFLDVVPEQTLAVLDPSELELALCGLATIDVEDWKSNTRYSGSIIGEERDEDPLLKWFWEIVEDFGQERKARLLQFVTGTSGVPVKGFGALRGTDGATKSFVIHVQELNKGSVYPRARTCFNRVDLPRYESKEELSSKLETALSISAVGFGMD